MAKGPIQLFRGGTGEQVFTGEASPAPGGGSMPFDPSTLPGLAVWLKADAIVGLSDDDPVATWADESGNGNDAVNATVGDQPIYKTAVLNGLPVVRFNNPGPNIYTHPQRLTLPLGLFRNIEGVSVAVVWFVPGSDDYMLAAASGTTTDNHRLLMEQASGSLQIKCSNDDAQDVIARAYRQVLPINDATGLATTFGAGVAWAAMSDGTCGAQGSNDIEQTGLAVIATTATVVFADAPGPTPDTDSLALNLGADTASNEGGNVAGMAGDIAEILIGTQAWNAKQRREVLEYLADKWNV